MFEYANLAFSYNDAENDVSESLNELKVSGTKAENHLKVFVCLQNAMFEVEESQTFRQVMGSCFSS